MIKLIKKIIKEAWLFFLALAVMGSVFPLLFWLTGVVWNPRLVSVPWIFFFGLLIIEMVCHLTGRREISDPNRARSVLKEEIEKASNKICISVLNPKIKVEKRILDTIKKKAEQGLWVEIVIGSSMAKEFLNFFREVLSLPNFELHKTEEYFPSGRMVLDGVKIVQLKAQPLGISVMKSTKGYALAARTVEGETKHLKECSPVLRRKVK